ncbi:MAG: sulfate adenylyltransferase subunit 1 [Polyangiales bacterium]
MRVATAGSVDDGKSTLLGRLLLDSKSLFTDQLAHVTEVSRRRGLGRTDLALLTDGLRAEREQGITIDVAWRFFATPARRFVLADSPGHVQYTRNMVTAASHADAAVILVDVRHGVVEQTRRHLFVSRLLGVRSIVVAVNKMDQVGYALDAFARVRDEVTEYLARVSVPRRAAEVAFIPVSALLGDNVVDASRAMPWYDGPTLLAHLERLPTDAQRDDAPARFAVQYVIRPQSAEHPDYRGYAGRMSAGSLRVGESVTVLPAGHATRLVAIDGTHGPVDEACAGQSITLRLADELDVSRGDTIVASAGAPPRLTRELIADVAWLHATPSRLRTQYVLKHTTREMRGFLEAIEARYDVATGEEVTLDSNALGLNDLARVRLRTSDDVAVDAYGELRTTGSFLLVDAVSGDTLAGGMVR